MKIRIKGNSVCYRLTKSEVTALLQNGKLEEQTAFISGTIIYAIEQTDQEQLVADLVQNKITLYGRSSLSGHGRQPTRLE